MRISSRTPPSLAVWMWALFILCALAFAFEMAAKGNIVDLVREEVRFALDPSVERAYEYGSYHFDARYPHRYDINRAERFFDAASRIDPDHPYVRHQQARIAFLEGDLAKALIFINLELENNSEPSPSSYYMRGLIEGYMGLYDAAIDDYARYLEADPANWAALNDYAWVFLKAQRYEDALRAVDDGLRFFPSNSWLLNSKAIALYELARYEEALQAARDAYAHVDEVTEEQWLTAYPGNDPQLAVVGINTLMEAIAKNIHRVNAKLLERTIQS